MFKILKLLDKEFKFDVIKFYFLLIFFTIFEFLAVFIILPISQVFFKKKIEIDFFLTDYLNNLDFNILVFVSLISLIIIYLIKNKILVYNAWWKLNLINRFEDKVSNKLIKKYLSKDFNFFQNYTAGNFNNYLSNEISNFSSSLLHALQIISEVVIFIVIACLLIFYQSTMTISLILLIFITALLTGTLLKRYSIKYGERWVKEGNNLNNFAIQCFNSINEIKVYSKINFFSNIFRNYKIKSLIAKRNASIIGEIPKPIFEFILILSFVSLIYFIFKNGDMNKLPEIMSLFLAGAYRLIPAATRFSTLYQNLNKNRYLIDNIINDLKISENENIEISKKDLIFSESIKINNIDFFYKNQKDKEKNIIFKNFSFEIKKNELVGIVGKSGCGKTTLLKLILGFLKPEEGQILIDDKKDISKNIDGWLRNISYVTQDPVIIEDNIITNVALSHDNIDIQNLKNSINFACLDEDLEKFPDGLNTFVGPGGVKLSGGQKQRVSLARAFYKNSNIIILDEPTSALDSVTEKNLIENLISLKNKTIIMVTHRTDLLERFNKIIKL